MVRPFEWVHPAAGDLAVVLRIEPRCVSTLAGFHPLRSLSQAGCTGMLTKGQRRKWAKSPKAPEAVEHADPTSL